MMSKLEALEALGLTWADLANLRTACLTSQMRSSADWREGLDKLAGSLWELRVQIETVQVNANVR